ncbi:DNA polymerase-3 subunit gamma/tau [Pilibacter termitis]|uniref:DNA-directed DNA polymerase n=1 Tax=Pilibacter termitis TaxID=263852 RepID=A0A1T4PIS8_9ENTE|nr:DNA polymerase III subunit gamma/tau [Pilibacter termitis]SJZ91443.1 DNA polymerase-3 subunit gamma/tau [Pilibacter termitis]
MAYQALYRTFRSQRFGDIVGQSLISKTLKNAVMNGTMSHAYLFTGPRGTGKTSAARIFAKAVNCTSTHDGEPCNECQTCKEITQGSLEDVIEIDAASNNGVEEIRRLRETVKFPPSVAKIKVYIIDEVHMLTNQAFNALLKTLEEPPERVLFVLATTEVHKVPATILSRTQRFDFKRISMNDIVEHLKHVLNEVNQPFEEEALVIIARAAQGGMRDALSILDQAISFSDEQLTKEVALKMTGSMTSEVLAQYFLAITEKNAEVALEIINEMLSSGKEAKRFVEDSLLFLRDALMIDFAPKFVEELSGENRSAKSVKEKMTREEVFSAIHVLNKTLESLSSSTNAQVQLEVMTIQMITPQQMATSQLNVPTSRELDGLKQEILLLQQEINELKTQPQPNAKATPQNRSNVTIKTNYKDPIDRILKLLPNATKEIRKEVREVWTDMLSMLSTPQRANFQRYSIVAATPNEVVIMFENNLSFLAEKISMDEGLKLAVSNNLSRLTRYAPELVPVTQAGWDKIKESFRAAQATEEVPKEVEKQKSDPIIQEATELFGDLVRVHEEE